MKKKIVSLLCAAAMMLALPTIAWAEGFDSPTGPSTPGSGTEDVLPDTGKDTSATSPQTGVDLTGFAVAGGAMLIAAGGVACALRKETAA